VDTHGERAEREPITESGAEPPAGSRDRAPGQGVRRAKPGKSGVDMSHPSPLHGDAPGNDY